MRRRTIGKVDGRDEKNPKREIAVPSFFPSSTRNQHETSLAFDTRKRVSVQCSERIPKIRWTSTVGDAYTSPDFWSRSRLGGMCIWKNTVRRRTLYIYGINVI